MEGTWDQVLVIGLYNSVCAKVPLPRPYPPVTRILPSTIGVAVWYYRLTSMEPAGDQALVIGSYTAALDRNPLKPYPPVIRTLPSSSGVAVWPKRAVAMEPAEDQVFVLGLYSSALDSGGAKIPGVLPPPVTR